MRPTVPLDENYLDSAVQEKKMGILDLRKKDMTPHTLGAFPSVLAMSWRANATIAQHAPRLLLVPFVC